MRISIFIQWNITREEEWYRMVRDALLNELLMSIVDLRARSLTDEWCVKNTYDIRPPKNAKFPPISLILRWHESKRPDVVVAGVVGPIICAGERSIFTRPLRLSIFGNVLNFDLFPLAILIFFFYSVYAILFFCFVKIFKIFLLSLPFFHYFAFLSYTSAIF